MNVASQIIALAVLFVCFMESVKSDEPLVYPTDSELSRPSRYSPYRGPYQEPYTPHFTRNNTTYNEEDFMPPLVRENKHTPFSGAPEYSSSPYRIPVDFVKDINKVSVNDLLLNYFEDDVDEVGIPSIGNRFGESEGEERSVASIPKAAGCAPEVRTVKLKNSDDPSILYIPQCTRVPQCGGCCSHPLLSCQPNETELVTFQVLKTQYNGNKKLKLVAKEPVVVEKHLSCKCDCKVKEENCNKYQEYRKSECRCACTNTDAENKCYKNYAKKLWNPELCACQCRDVFQCSTGYSFDSHECKCVPVPIRRRYTIRDDPSEVLSGIEYN